MLHVGCQAERSSTQASTRKKHCGCLGVLRRNLPELRELRESCELPELRELRESCELRELWELRESCELWELWELCVLPELCELWELWELCVLPELWELCVLPELTGVTEAFRREGLRLSEGMARPPRTAPRTDGEEWEA